MSVTAQGGVKEGESLLDAAQRQLVEETGPDMDVWAPGRVPAGAFEAPKGAAAGTRVRSSLLTPLIWTLRPHQLHLHPPLSTLASPARADLLLRQTFFLPMRIIRGSPVPTPSSSLADYAWCTKEEVAQKVDEKYYAAVKDMLSER